MTLEEYEKKYETKYTDKALKDYEEQKAKNEEISNKYIADMNSAIDESTANAVGKVNAQINELPTYYQTAFDANAVQEEVNKRKAKEYMANLGLTDSGLNQMQQTAFMVARQNADYALNQKKTAAVNSLKQQIADLEASAEVEKKNIKATETANLATTNKNLYSSLMSDAQSRAQSDALSAYNQQQSAIAEANKERIAMGDLNADGVYGEDEIEALITKNKLANGEYEDIIAAYTPVQDQDGNTGYLGYAGLEAQKAAQETGEKPTKDEFLEAYAAYIIGFDSVANAKQSESEATWVEDAKSKGGSTLSAWYSNHTDLDYNAIAEFVEGKEAGVDKTWTVVNDGGGKGIGVIDDNAAITYGGYNFTMRELYNALVAAGMSKKRARNKIRDIQYDFGITKTW